MSLTVLTVEAQSVFNDFDRDKNGKIDDSELGTALRMLGLNPTKKEIDDMMQEVDNDGKLSAGDPG